MRLLSRDNNRLQLTTYLNDPQEPYAILSHTWGPDSDEVSFEDVHNGIANDKLGYQKLDFCLEQAKKDGYNHVWIDTCCIDKRDRNELGEAINKMYDWYAKSAVCYVYLADVFHQEWELSFVNSRWHRRGWTLQELVAPQTVCFYSCDRRRLGDRASLREHILKATSIDMREPLSRISLPKRYEWSLMRQTTKAEDASYCMLGLLEVSLIFNYGENAIMARERLFAEVEAEHGRRVSRDIRQIHAEWEARPQRDMVLSNFGQLTITRFMDALKFVNMNARRATINDPYPSTCTWLTEHPDYQRWLARESECFLWIKGKPGAGKSTIVKFAESQSAGLGIQIDFFFNARGDELERSTMGMYRSLLYQLLESIPYLRDAVLDFIDHHRKYTGRPWTLTKANVQTVFRFVVSRLEKPVLCFIDALDECPLIEVQEMVQFFEDLIHDRRTIFICFASRYYPAVTIRNSIQLHLEGQGQDDDLERYVNGRLAIDDYPEGAALKQQILQKANGVFFWLVLVVKLLNQELINGNIFNVQKRLDEMPAGLSQLLKDIVEGPGSNDQLRLCLQWILLARRPLFREEYYFAVVTGLAQSGLADAKAFTTAWNEKLVTREQMDKFVNSSSKGLARVTKSADGAETVQFIHESVRDFFLQNASDNGQPTSVSLTSYANHDELKKICQIYTAGVADFNRPVSKQHAAFPFLAYASEQVLYHAEQAAEQIMQGEFLESFDFELWWRMFDVREYSKLNELSTKHAKIFYILTAANAPKLIATARNVYGKGSDLSLPMFASIRRHFPDSLQTLLECGVDLEATDYRGDTALLIAVSKEHYDLAAVKLLLQQGANTEAQDSRGRTALLEATHLESSELVETLLKYRANTNVRDEKGDTPLVIAIEKGQISIAKTLLSHGAQLDVKDRNGKTPLLMACRNAGIRAGEKDGAFVEMLLKYRPNLETTDENGKTALIIASEYLSVAVTKMLLARGANANCQDRFARSPLTIACTHSTMEIAEMLLEAGAEPNILLEVSGWYRKEKFIELLLDHGASINARDCDGVTALMVASRWSRLDAVQVLLKRGARLDAIDKQRRSAFDWATKELNIVPIAHDPQVLLTLWQALDKLAESRGV